MIPCKYTTCIDVPDGKESMIFHRRSEIPFVPKLDAEIQFPFYCDHPVCPVYSRIIDVCDVMWDDSKGWLQIFLDDSGIEVPASKAREVIAKMRDLGWAADECTLSLYCDG